MSLIKIYYHDNDDYLPLSQAGCHPDLIAWLQEGGIIEAKEDMITGPQFRKLQKLLRLYNSLGINLNAAAIILELLERIEVLEEEIERLRKTR